MSTQDLQDTAARAKLKELAEDIDFAMFATNLGQLPAHIIPMSTKKVDDDGKIWFLSGRDSTHNHNINADPRVQLVYADKSAMEFLTVYGVAQVVTDRDTLEKLYTKQDDAWFDGLDDPNLSALAITPAEAHYWDPKSNKLVTLVKMAAAAITGNHPDLMDQGKLSP